MNQPDRYERFVAVAGDKVVLKQDTRIENAATFLIAQEDHTMGNLLKMQLHEDKSVIFAGYRVPHPLEHKMVIKVQTNGSKSPAEALEHSLEDLGMQFTALQERFDMQLSRVGDTSTPRQTPQRD